MLGNALQLDWADILEPDQCSFVIGNPPFLGARNQSKEQKAELQAAFKSIGATKNLGNIDYVGGWYAKALSTWVTTTSVPPSSQPTASAKANR